MVDLTPGGRSYAILRYSVRHTIYCSDDSDENISDIMNSDDEHEDNSVIMEREDEESPPVEHQQKDPPESPHDFEMRAAHFSNRPMMRQAMEAHKT